VSIRPTASRQEQLATAAEQPLRETMYGCGPRRGATQPTSATSVLIIDDDAGTCETFECALRKAGFLVRTARSGGEGLRIAKTGSFDLLLVDLALPDIRGTDVIRALHALTARCPFILASGFLTTEITVEAMRLGAIDVIEKPISIDDLPGIVFSAVRRWHGRGDRLSGGPERLDPRLPAEPRGIAETGSAAARWAMHVMKGCQSASDLKTLDQWAKCIGVSYTGLRESCRLVGIRPFAARDFLRVLRAVLHASVRGCPPEVLLDVSDERTLDGLVRRAGFGLCHQRRYGSVDAFFRYQQLVPADNTAVRLVCSMLTS
jgi:CheY-like chemotaxis protein